MVRGWAGLLALCLAARAWAEPPPVAPDDGASAAGRRGDAPAPTFTVNARISDVIAEPARIDRRPAPVPVRTWIVNDEAFGELIAGGRWSFWGSGLGVTRTVIGPLEVGLEGQALRLDAEDPDDPRHGLALRAGATLGCRFTIRYLRVIHFGIEPQVGVAAATVLGLGAGARGQHEIFAGLRGSFHVAFDERPAQHLGQARGIGAHLTLRLARAEGKLAASVLIGYDWGL